MGLPTYPFQRKRFWIEPSAGAGDVSGAGQGAADHPLLGAVIDDPAGEGLTLTGRLSLQTHPWLADHAVAAAILLPGAAFLELALRAGEEAGCEQVEELTLQAPLILPEQGAAQIQVSVSGPDEEGRRELQVHSRAEAAGEEEAGSGPATPRASSPPNPQMPPSSSAAGRRRGPSRWRSSPSMTASPRPGLTTAPPSRA